MDWRYHILKKTGVSFYTKERSGMTLEFIGTSGVGKTTLFRESMSKIPGKWFFAHYLEFLKRKAPSDETDEIDEILMRILESRIEKIYNSDSFCPWHSFLDLLLSVRVTRATMLVNRSALPQGFAFDEGLFRHFPAEILQLGDEFPLQLWKNRAFIYLRARNPETAFSRIKSRTMTLAEIERQRSRTDDQRMSSIVHDQEMFQSIINTAISFGCPVLVIDAENPFKDSVQKVLDFEGSLSERFNLQKNMETNPQLDISNR